jgi:hypothetical protein
MIRPLNKILFCFLEERYINKLLSEDKKNFLLEQKAKILRDLLDLIKSGKLDPLEVKINIGKIVDQLPEDMLSIAQKTGKRGEDLVLEFFKKYPDFKFDDYPDITRTIFQAADDVEIQLSAMKEKGPIKFPEKKPDEVAVEGDVVKKLKPEEVSTEKPTELKLTRDEPETGPDPFKFPKEEMAPPKEEKAPPKEEVAPPEKPFEPPVAPKPSEKAPPKPSEKAPPKPSEEAPPKEEVAPKEEAPPSEEDAPLPKKRVIPLPEPAPLPRPSPLPKPAPLPLPKAETYPKRNEEENKSIPFGFTPFTLPSIPDKPKEVSGAEIPYDIDAILDRILGKYSTSLRIR